MSPARPLLLASLLVGILVAAPGASAMYIITPLKVQVSDDTPHVGDTVTLTIVPDPESNHTSLAGQTVTIRYNFDPQEGEENSTPPEDGQAHATFRDIGVVTLDDKQGATLTWTIPQELDDHNAFLTVVDAAGEDVGAGYGPVAVGDAPPIMMVMRNTPGEGGPVDGAPVEENDGGAIESGDADESGGSNAVPAVGLGLMVALVALAAFAVSRRR